jgi:outer membrane protein OmpA-like peptidoglycan-associated protein
LGKIGLKKLPLLQKDSLMAILLLLFLTCTINSQAQSEKKIYHKAKKQLIAEQYDKSKDNYKKLIELNSDKAIYYFEAGLAYYFSQKNREEGIELFEKSLTKFKKDTIPETFYYLGKLYHYNHQFNESTLSLKTFENYLTSTPGGNQLKSEITQIMNNNNFALQQKENSTIEIKNIRSINTEYADYAPVKKPNSEVLLFTSRRKGSTGGRISYDSKYYEDIYVATNQNGTWTLVDKENIEKHIYESMNTKFHDAAVMYSNDGNKLYLYKDAQMWESKFENDKWTIPVRLPIQINQKKTHVPSVAMSPDGNTIYFSSDKKGGYGGKDLYYSKKISEGEWSEPINLGEKINTSEDEDAPFISKDGKMLYFSSKGHNSIGNYDVFKVEITENNSFSEPVNLGMPINSAADDIFFITTKDENSGFLSSNRVKGYGDMDIYEFSESHRDKILALNGLVYDSQTGLPIGTTLKFSHSNNTSTLVTSPSNGRYQVKEIKTDQKYSIEINAEGYQPHILEFTIPKNVTQQEVFQLITLKPIQSSTGKKYKEIATVHSLIKSPKQNEIDSSIIIPNISKEDQQKISFIYNEIDNEGILTHKHIVDIDTLQLTGGDISTDYPNIENIYFHFDKSFLTDSAKNELDLVINYLKKYPDLKIEVIGHADALGDDPYNNKLSKTRAISTQKYLVKNGIVSQRIITKWDGAAQPIAPNTLPSGEDNPQGRSKNRRVEIRIINKSMR